MVAIVSNELVLKPSKLKHLGYAAAVAACAGLGVALGPPPPPPIIAILSLGVGPLATLFFVWSAFSPRLWLRLTDEGFSFGTLRRRAFYRWSDVARFGTLRLAHRNVVCFEFDSRFVGEERVRRINQDFGRFDRFLPDTYGMNHEELAVLLEVWRHDHSPP